ncbi:outer membrane protein assembly factor BamD [Aliidiomarina quisquiliarum]|uniref:outer membrane protein assembly factor BamD n=1 Tax=Aliidiomarina quisquiliarum TaxID=2938947 RepID=UPI00208E1F2C|nr:outer membrane protein assembly factor BamD [Aliidiomarina quisquiliarum]MCO4322078.1 outer membrane protein assembly factor BamD [Aliidiomarina quisquiliarum]
MRLVVAAVLASVVILSGCSSKPKEQIIERSTIEHMYETSQVYLDVGRFTEAAQLLTAMSTRYPFGPYTQQVQLDLIYALYKIGDQDKALSHIDRFLQLNPNHADLDYVRYMRGLVYQQAEFSIFQDMFNIDRSDRSPYYAQRAFEEFGELLRLYPSSAYAADAQARMIGLSSRLAKHELSVAEYYQRRGAFLAAANRAKAILEAHPNTPEQKQALEIMVHSYQQLGLTEQSEDAKGILQANFANSRG